MDVVINTQFLRSECDNILQGFSIVPPPITIGLFSVSPVTSTYALYSALTSGDSLGKNRGLPIVPISMRPFSSSSLPWHISRTWSAFKVTGTRISIVQEITPSCVFTMPLQKVRSPYSSANFRPTPEPSQSVPMWLL